MAEEGKVQDWTAIPIEDLVERLIACDEDAVRIIANEIIAFSSVQQLDELTEALKDRCIQSFGENFLTAQRCADLVLEIAEKSNKDLYRAMGLRLCAQVCMLGKGEFRQALELYEQALEIHRQHNDLVGQALIYTTSIWAMANLGQYEEAVEKGEWACGVFEAEERWKDLAKIQSNLAAIHNRSREYQRALTSLDRVSLAYQRMGDEGELLLAGLETNRALALFALSRLPESLEASQKALHLAGKHQQLVTYARAQHNKAFTCFFMGEYNRALDLLISARNQHQSIGQHHEAALCEFTRADFLLRLGRYESVLHLVKELIPLLTDLGMRMETAEATFTLGVAQMGCGDFVNGFDTIKNSRELLIDQKANNLAAQAELELALFYMNYGDISQSISIAKGCQATFDDLGLNYERAQVRLLLSQANLNVGNIPEAERALSAAESIINQEPWPELLFEVHQLKGMISRQLCDFPQAVTEFNNALSVLSQLRKQVMLEYRPSFLQNKNQIFPSLVNLYLEMNEPQKALDMVEHAKSQAIVDVLTGQTDLKIIARHDDDIPLTETVHSLMDEHQKAWKRFDTLRLDSSMDSRDELIQTRIYIQALESDITEKWHQLLIRNSDYALDASTWKHIEEHYIQYLEPGTLLIEYYCVGEQVLVFQVFFDAETNEYRVSCIQLQALMSDVERLMQRFWVNLSAIQHADKKIKHVLHNNALGILEVLFHQLLDPCSQMIRKANRLLIIPFGKLHYLPFHALYDGDRYLIERVPVRYMPAASLMRFYQQPVSSSKGCLVMGHSFYGKLRHTIEEANAVARNWGVRPYLEDLARMQDLKVPNGRYRLIHLACHGEFHPENPLFSGLALEDGWLTTLDIFNLRLEASLVTLSACQTGRSVIEGGDELSGLMRAFLTAGAKSLVLSHWTVQDRATLSLMITFYHALLDGAPKDLALQQAQVKMLSMENDGERLYAHPFYWAPFFLVGNGGPL